MNLEKIISITGKPGLYKVLSQTKNGLIVESVIDGKRMPVHASDKVSALNDISIYTYDGDMPLADIYKKIYEKTEGKKAVNHKASHNELKDFLKEIMEDFDQERVYYSDLKKLFLWFNLLVENNLLKPDENEKEEEGKVKSKTTTVKTIKKKVVAKPKGPKTSGVKGSSKTTTPSKRGK